MKNVSFRVWDKREKVMRSVINLFANGHVYVDCQCNDKEKMVYHRDKTNYNLPHHLNGKDVVLMMSTGLNDKHGKEIFEGDLITSTTWESGTEVYYEGGAFCVGRPSSEADFLGGIAAGCEITGNIYETV